MPEKPLQQGEIMFTYEFHELRSAELRSRAEHARLVREAAHGRRAARRSAAHEARESQAHSDGPRRHRFARAA